MPRTILKPPKRYKAKVEIYQDRAGEWRWRLRSRNGGILGDSSEGYAARWNCEEAWRTIEYRLGIVTRAVTNKYPRKDGGLTDIFYR